MGDPKVSDGFFSTLVGLDAGEALERCKARVDELRAEVKQLQDELGQTPRADKQGAHAIRQAILHTQSKLGRMKPVIAGYRDALERREAHGLWAEGVRAMCGSDALRDVYDWMAAEKKRRAIARKAEVQA